MANLCTGNMVIWAKIWRMNRSCLGEEFFHASKVMFEILQVRLHHYMNQELTDVQAGFIKGRGTRDQIANIHWIIEKAREFQKNIYLCFTDYAKAFDFVDHKKLENLKRWEYQTALPVSWETFIQVKKQQVEPDMEQQWFQFEKRVRQGCVYIVTLFI